MRISASRIRGQTFQSNVGTGTKISVAEPEPRAEEPKLSSILELELKLRISAPAPASFYLSKTKFFRIKSWLLKKVLKIVSILIL